MVLMQILICLLLAKREKVIYHTSSYTKLYIITITYHPNIVPSCQGCLLNICVRVGGEALKKILDGRKLQLMKYRHLKKKGTWEPMDLLARKRTVSNQRVCALKYNPDSTIQWYKARLVTKVFFSQSYGMDYTETFS